MKIEDQLRAINVPKQDDMHREALRARLLSHQTESKPGHYSRFNTFYRSMTIVSAAAISILLLLTFAPITGSPELPVTRFSSHDVFAAAQKAAEALSVAKSGQYYEQVLKTTDATAGCPPQTEIVYLYANDSGQKMYELTTTSDNRVVSEYTFDAAGMVTRSHFNWDVRSTYRGKNWVPCTQPSALTPQESEAYTAHEEALAQAQGFTSVAGGISLSKIGSSRLMSFSLINPKDQATALNWLKNTNQWRVDGGVIVQQYSPSKPLIELSFTAGRITQKFYFDQGNKAFVGQEEYLPTHLAPDQTFLLRRAVVDSLPDPRNL